MAKKNVSARVPPQIADGIDEYAETWDLNRTDALTVLLQTALEDPPNPREVEVGGDVSPTERVYTFELSPENAEYVEGADGDPDEAINRLLDIYRR
jgi:hypothetical protein